jgi:hypothetical protein
MKMLLFVFRSSLEDEMLRLLKEQNVSSFTAIPSVLGVGETGKALGTLDSAGTNSLVLVVLEDDPARQLESAFRSYYEILVEKQQGTSIPMTLFELPCQKII